MWAIANCRRTGIGNFSSRLWENLESVILRYRSTKRRLTGPIMLNEFFNPLFYFYVSEWAIRLVLLGYGAQWRHPAAARTWLLFIFVLPWPGLIIFGILGRAYKPKKRLRMQEAVSRLIRTTGRELSSPFITRPALTSEF